MVPCHLWHTGHIEILLAKASEGRAVAPQALQEKMEGSYTPTLCRNTWETCEALLPQESGRTGPGGNDWLRIKNVPETGERQNKYRLYSHFFLQTSTLGSLMLMITFVFSSFSCFTHLSGSLIGQQCGANLALHNKVAISFDFRN